jgi:hypothetical protein
MLSDCFKSEIKIKVSENAEVEAGHLSKISKI